MENKEENLDEIEILIKEKLGIEYDKLASNISNINKMAWEQVLLLAIYARYQYYGDKGSHFHSRMKMMKAIMNRHQDDNAITTKALSLLDSGEGMVALVNFLNQYNDTEDFKNHSVARPLLAEIEKQQIAYARLPAPYIYSHYCMYKMLYRPLEVFQYLLSLPSAQSLIFGEVAYQLKKLAYDDIEITQSWKETRKPTIDIPKLISYLNEKNVSIDTQLLTKNITNSLDDYLSNWMQNVFNLVLPQHNDNNDNRNSLPSPFDKMYQISQIDGKITVELDKVQCSHLCDLGQLDEVMRQMRNSLATEINQKYEQHIKPAKNSPSSDLANWFIAVKTEWFNREDRIPKMVAVILEFDILNCLGFFEQFNKRRGQKINKPTSAKLTTYIIDHCLYKNGSIYDFGKNCMNGFNIELFDRFLPNESPTQYLASDLMAAWADLDETKMKNRFKRPREELNNVFYSVTEQIEQQKIKAIDKPYPINSAFALPLWAY